jgi:hypothetical protein
MRSFMKTTDHKKVRETAVCLVKELDHTINKGDLEALCERRITMNAPKKLLASATGGIQMKRAAKRK